MVTQQAGVAKAAEQQQREALKQKQRAAHDAFLNDLVLYKTQGTLPSELWNILNYRKNTYFFILLTVLLYFVEKSEDLIEVDKQTTLEEIQLDSDDAELDEFLNK